MQTKEQYEHDKQYFSVRIFQSLYDNSLSSEDMVSILKILDKPKSKDAKPICELRQSKCFSWGK